MNSGICVFDQLCVACHGLSVLVSGRRGDQTRTVLFDVGPYGDVWLDNAARLGIDPDRIAAGGGSAGGHVATATGTLSKLDDPNDDQTISSRPNALLLYNPVYDNGPDGGWAHDRVKDYWEDISPAHNIDAQTPPAIVFDEVTKG